MTTYNDYKNFVNNVSSKETQNNNDLINRLIELSNNNVKVSNLLTGAIGLAGESGEVADLIKKIIFQGKNFTPDVKEKIIDECSDVLWYLTQIMIGLDCDIEYLINHNISKLSKRYPGNKFDINKSENR